MLDLIEELCTALPEDSYVIQDFQRRQQQQQEQQNCVNSHRGALDGFKTMLARRRFSLDVPSKNVIQPPASCPSSTQSTRTGTDSDVPDSAISSPVQSPQRSRNIEADVVSQPSPTTADHPPCAASTATHAVPSFPPQPPMSSTHQPAATVTAAAPFRPKNIDHPAGSAAVRTTAFTSTRGVAAPPNFRHRNLVTSVDVSARCWSRTGVDGQPQQLPAASAATAARPGFLPLNSSTPMSRLLATRRASAENGAAGSSTSSMSSSSSLTLASKPFGPSSYFAEMFRHRAYSDTRAVDKMAALKALKTGRSSRSRRNSDTLSRNSSNSSNKLNNNNNNNSNSTATLRSADAAPIAETTSLPDSDLRRPDTNESGFVDCDPPESTTTTTSGSQSPPPTYQDRVGSPPPGILNIPVIRIIEDTIPEHDEIHHVDATLGHHRRSSLFCRLPPVVDAFAAGSTDQPSAAPSRRDANGGSCGPGRLAVPAEISSSSRWSSRRYSEPSMPNLINLVITDPFQAASFSASLRRTIPTRDETNSTSGKNYGIDLPYKRNKYLIWKDDIAGTHVFPVREATRLAGPADEQMYVRLMRTYHCYDLMPNSSKLVIFDSQLDMNSAFEALVFNGVKSAPICHLHDTNLIGMLTVTDFIRVLHKLYYECPEELDRMDQHTIQHWREMLNDDHLKPIVSVDADQSLYDAIFRLHDNNFRRILVLDEKQSNAVYMLTHRRIVQFIAVLMEDLSLPDFMRKSIFELGVGTYSDIASVKMDTKLIDALSLFIDRRVSALPVVDDDNRLVHAYSKFDTINLVGGKKYRNLECTVEEILQAEHLNTFEGVLMCRKHDPLASIIKYMVHSDVHRLWVTSDTGVLEGVVSLSDIIQCLVVHKATEAFTDEEAEIYSSDTDTDDS